MSAPSEKLPPTVGKHQLCELRDNIMAAVDEDWIVCLECGARFVQLGTHLNFAHGTSSSKYKERWGYNKNYGLTCGSRKRRMSEVMVEVIEHQGKVKWASRARRALEHAARGTGLEEGHRPQALVKIHDQHTRRKIDGKRVERLFVKGHSQSEIARRLGRSHTAVSRHLKAAGLVEPDPARWTGGIPEAELMKLLRKGLAPEEIAEQRGLRADTVRRRVFRIMKRRRLKEIDSARLLKLRRNPRRSVYRDHIECLICGSRTRNLRDHLRGHRLTLRGYLRRYGLKRADVPVAVFNRTAGR